MVKEQQGKRKTQTTWSENQVAKIRQQIASEYKSLVSSFSVDQIIYQLFLIGIMNVEVESANRSDSSDPLPGPVNFLDCKRKHRVRQREQRKYPGVAASLYCPWSMAQSALGFITGNGTVLGMGLGSTCTRSLSPSPPPLSLSPQPVVSDEPDSSRECYSLIHSH